VRDVFSWRTGAEVRQEPRPLYRPDAFLSGLEQLIEFGRAWAPIGGETKRTEPLQKVERWCELQNGYANLVENVTGHATTFRLSPDRFPRDDSGDKVVIATGRRIVYLVDMTRDVLDIAERAWGRQLGEDCNPDLPAFIYVTNSLEAGGRAFGGDPFTGQLAAYLRVFAYDVDNRMSHTAFAYYPNQLYTQIFLPNGRPKSNKGTRLIAQSGICRLLMAGGHAVAPHDWSVP
jgi:hypothetical protein